jgi:D-arabinose 1-dehydrogenase-like Zn-dependent alcohol dehydrogenase
VIACLEWPSDAACRSQRALRLVAGSPRGPSQRKLRTEVCRFADPVEARTVEMGDRVAIHMLMISETASAMLAGARCAVHTALTYNLVGEDVLITGAGPIGIMAAAVARHVGARHVVITDVNPKRLALAAEVADVLPVDVSKEDLKHDLNSKLTIALARH